MVCGGWRWILRVVCGVDIEGGMWRVEVDIEGGMWRVGSQCQYHDC